MGYDLTYRIQHKDDDDYGKEYGVEWETVEEIKVSRHNRSLYGGIYKKQELLEQINTLAKEMMAENAGYREAAVAKEIVLRYTGYRDYDEAAVALAVYSYLFGKLCEYEDDYEIWIRYD